MSHLPEKIQSVTQELGQVQQEMQAAAPKLAPVDSSAPVSSRQSSITCGSFFGTTLRLIPAHSGHSVKEEVRSLRLQRVTEMLHAIQQEVKARGVTPTPAPVTFLNAVQEIADAAFERHSGAATGGREGKLGNPFGVFRPTNFAKC